MEIKGIGIIFHSGSFDRLYHGLSISLAALSLGREVKLFFTYWALEYLRKKDSVEFSIYSEKEEHEEILKKNIDKGHLLKIRELIQQVKAMGGKFYACTHSMGILNIIRNELIDEVDKIMGLTTWLTETKEYQIIFI